jgi:hypothetical protein
LFLTKDGLAGFALKDGRISSVFNHRSSDVRDRLRCLVGLAIQEGGWAIDVFDTVLPHLYGAAKFRTACRMRWCEDHAPIDWNHRAFHEFNQGQPDIVFMVYDPGEPRHYMPGEGSYVESIQEAQQVQRDVWNRANQTRTEAVAKLSTPTKASPSSALEDWLCN